MKFISSIVHFLSQCIFRAVIRESYSNSVAIFTSFIKVEIDSRNLAHVFKQPIYLFIYL